MSARDGYPAISEWAYEAGHPLLGFGAVQRECQRAMDEIDRLRAESEPCRCGECGGQLRWRCVDCNTWHGPAAAASPKDPTP